MEHCNFGQRKAVTLHENRENANSLPSNSGKEFCLFYNFIEVGTEKEHCSLIVLLNTIVLCCFLNLIRF